MHVKWMKACIQFLFFSFLDSAKKKKTVDIVVFYRMGKFGIKHDPHPPSSAFANAMEYLDL